MLRSSLLRRPFSYGRPAVTETQPLNTRVFAAGRGLLGVLLLGSGRFRESFGALLRWTLRNARNVPSIFVDHERPRLAKAVKRCLNRELNNIIREALGSKAGANFRARVMRLPMTNQDQECVSKGREIPPVAAINRLVQRRP